MNPPHEVEPPFFFLTQPFDVFVATFPLAEAVESATIADEAELPRAAAGTVLHHFTSFLCSVGVGTSSRDHSNMNSSKLTGCVCPQ